MKMDGIEKCNARPNSLLHRAYVTHGELFGMERAFPTMGSFLGPGGSVDRFLVCRKTSGTDIPITSARNVADMLKVMGHGPGTTRMGKSGINEIVSG